MPGKYHIFVSLLVVIAMCGLRGPIGSVLLVIVMGYLILVDFGMAIDGFDLGLELVVEFVVFGLVVPGAPVVEVAVDAVLNFYEHVNYTMIEYR